ncbi:MAG: ABC transporter permease subunit [bacterium]|nr:ABC transporter permease subunit [bacterium]
MDSGEILSQSAVAEGRAITASAYFPNFSQMVIGFSDGTVSIADVKYDYQFLDPSDTPDEYHDMAVNETRVQDGALLTRIPNGQYRRQSFSIEPKEPIDLGDDDSAVTGLDYTVSPSGLVFAALSDNGTLSVNHLEERTNFMTGETAYTASGRRIAYESGAAGPPSFIRITGLGDNIYLIWKDGTLHRYDARSDDAPLLETLDLTGDNAQVTTARFLIGRNTLLVGDSNGEVHSWFRVRRPGANTADERVLVDARGFGRGGSPVTTLAVSQRGRIFAVGYQDGHIELTHGTSAKQLANIHLEDGGPVSLLNLPGKDDGLLAGAGGSIHRWTLDPGHPEVTWASIFTPVWYEGYEKPMYVWQSSSGTDDFEPKYGLYPLIFGSVKATFYSMLFGLPLALLAAIYTSEFLSPRSKAMIKPTIELMASLPSVVLGFLAALVFAPWIEKIVPATLCMFATLPLTFLAGAYLFQMLPEYWYLRLSRYRFILILAVMPLGFCWALQLGPVAERWLFAGDIRLWLDGQIGGATGGWMFPMTPICALAAFVVMIRWVNPWLRVYTANWGRGAMAIADAVRALAGVAMALGGALAVSSLFAAIGLDPRGAYIGTYVQRNALIVGFVMGFAVIPIIYTIADDALSSVPDHLRSASLGCGATPWQTALYIVIPTAMSGLFSATMIGLGRAVGETMIVLMAAGNTPVMDWNIFNGFRTLSANIAVELPEAVRNSTHYRMLFLAALTLFVMTFILNTVAELVRLRFRKRTYEL